MEAEAAQSARQGTPQTAAQSNKATGTPTKDSPGQGQRERSRPRYCGEIVIVSAAMSGVFPAKTAQSTVSASLRLRRAVRPTAAEQQLVWNKQQRGWRSCLSIYLQCCILLCDTHTQKKKHKTLTKLDVTRTGDSRPTFRQETCGQPLPWRYLVRRKITGATPQVQQQQ